MNGEKVDSTEVHFDPRRGELSLTCGSEAFARLLKAVQTESGLNDFNEIDWAAVQNIEVQMSPRPVRGV
jgi:hypothetical protein